MEFIDGSKHLGVDRSAIKAVAHRDKNFPEFDLSMSDLRRFIGILVLSANNCLTHLPVQSVSRRVKGQSQTYVKQPFLVRKYNESMGGVDLFDRLLSSYRPAIRGKK